MEDNKWMIVKKEKISTKIKNYFKNIFSKILNGSNKNKKNKSKGLWPKNKEKGANRELREQETIREIPQKEYVPQPRNNKEITIEVAPNKRKPKELVIEYENNNKMKKKQIVVEYQKNERNRNTFKPQQQVHENALKQNMQYQTNTEKTQFIKREAKQEVKPQIQKEVKVEVPKAIRSQIRDEQKRETIKQEVKREEKVELALKPVKAKKERKPFNIFQFFKDKERKKRKEILNRLRENKVDDYETISTKTKLSKGSIAVDDVDANELDPLINLYRDSNTKLRNRIREFRH